jgi:hypothetical protein
VKRAQLDFDQASSTAPSDLEAGVDGQSVEPGIDPIEIAQPRQVSPGSEERLLDRVSRELVIPEDEPGCRVSRAMAWSTSTVKAS